MGYPRVHLHEEVMREGMQIESVDITVEEKVALLNAIARCGLEAIDVGSFVSPKWTPQMANLDEVLRRFEPVAGPRYYALALNQRGLDRAAEFGWLDPVIGPPMISVHLCDTFARRNTNRPQAEEIASWSGSIDRAVANGATECGVNIGAAWGSNFHGVFTLDDRLAMLRRQFAAWEQAGVRVTTIALADPMSWCMPHWVEETLAAIKREWPQVKDIRLHLHDGRGMALPSIYAAIRALDETFDVTFDVTAGGIGGCPYCGNGRATGMAATEDVVVMCEAMGIKTGVEIDRLIDFVHLLEDVLGRATPGHVAKVGPLPMVPLGFYDPNLPLVETFEEAQHFRLGPEVTAHQLRPWREPLPPINPTRS